MDNKKIRVPIYKLSDLATFPIIESSEGLEELVVRIDEVAVKHEAFEKYFRSDFFLIFLVTDGIGTVNINLKEYSITKNSIILTTPNDLKQFLYDDKIKTLSALAFTADFLSKSGMTKNAPEVLNYFSTQFSPVWELNTQDAGMVKNLLVQILHRHRKREKHPFGEELLYNSFTTLLYEMAGLSSKYAKLINTSVSRKENLIINFMSLVQKHFTSQRNVSQYASQLHISPKYLTETIKEISGKTAGEIIDDFVIQESILLLRNLELSIAEIAEQLHFSDQSFFGKYFKRHTGLSPKEYRKLL